MCVLLTSSIRDVLKKSFLESSMYEQAISLSMILTIIVDLCLSLLIGILIFNVYKRLFQGVVYSKTFGITLIGMTVLTCGVTLAISSNVVISLGMVGALSIVRFRTAVKEPLDLLYLFWAITMGISIGASMYLLVICILAIMILLLKIMYNKNNTSNTYFVIMHYTKDETGDKALKILDNINYQIKSKIMRKTDIEMTLQVILDNDDMRFSERIKELDDINDITLVQFDGEYHG